MTLREELEALEYKRDDEINDGLAPWPALDAALSLCRRAVEDAEAAREEWKGVASVAQGIIFAQRCKLTAIDDEKDAEIARLRADCEALRSGNEALRGELADIRKGEAWEVARLRAEVEARDRIIESWQRNEIELDEDSAETDREITALRASEQQAAALLDDALSGWRYIRQTHGDMYGVGWNRVEDGIVAFLRSRSAAQAEEASDHD